MFSGSKMEKIIWLENISKDAVDLVGSKGAQLGELKKTGLQIPDGFVITTDVYKDIIKKSQLSKELEDVLSKLNVENTKELEQASNKIQSFITSMELPTDVEKSIIESYKKLGGLVAVRSSATAEDLKEASFAGQLSTFLNISEGRLIESVKKCIASLFTARAIYYRHQKNIDHMKSSIAVLVQKMIKSKKAGVAFSINPVTNKEEIVIEAVSGLGEAVVGGQTIPDNYIVVKETNKIKESRISKDLPVLNDVELSQLSEIIKKIEEHYNFPQDIEWTIDDKIYILQARPITTLQVRKKPDWTKILAREYGVQYTELSLRCLSPENKSIVPAPFYEQIYIPEDGNEACYMDKNKWNEFVTSLKKKYLENLENYEEFEKMFMETGNDYMKTAEQIAKSNLKGKNNKELKEVYLNYQSKNLRYGPFIWMQFIINNFFADKSKEIITNKLGVDNKNLFDFIEVAFKPDKKVASIQLIDIATGWENLNEGEKSSIYEQFKWLPCLDVHNKPWTKEEFFSHINEFKKTEKKLSVTYEMLIKQIKPSKKEKQILDATKRLSYLKDLKDDFRRQGILHGQKLFGEIANRMGIGLQDISYVTKEEITEFLDNDNVISKNVIEDRKKGFAIYFNQEKKIECRSGKDIEPALNELGIVVSEEFSEEIKGTPASPGRAKGIVTIVKGVSDLTRVKKGNILVAVTTHPDYVPAMQRAVAIVTDEGGVTSHAAIISRELGLPCVVGTKYATKSLKDGDEIEIDANTGVVRKIKK